MKKLLVSIMFFSLLIAAAVCGGCGSGGNNAERTLTDENIIASVKSGGEFKLGGNVTVNAEQLQKSLGESGKPVNIDLDGNKLSLTSKTLTLAETQLKVTNGELVCANSNAYGTCIAVGNGSSLTLENLSVVAAGVAVEARSNAAAVIIDGCTVKSAAKRSLTAVAAEGEETLGFTVKNTVIEQNPQSNSSTAIALYAGNALLDSVTVTGAWFGLNMFDTANATVKNSHFTCTHACILSAWVQDSTFTGTYSESSKVTVESGTYIIDGSGQGTAYLFSPVHWSGAGTLDILDGTFENKNTNTGAGVYVRNGTVNVKGGKVTAATALKISAEFKDTVRATLNVYGGEIKAYGAAAYLFTNVVGNLAKRLELNVYGGSFSGSSCIAVNLNDVGADFTYGAAVSGGTFDKSVSVWLKTGYVQTENADGTFTVKSNQR